MEKIPLVAVFWDHRDAEDGEDALVHVEDGAVIYLTRADGLEVRLLITEVELIYRTAMRAFYGEGET